MANEHVHPTFQEWISGAFPFMSGEQVPTLPRRVEAQPAKSGVEHLIACRFVRMGRLAITKGIDGYKIHRPKEHCYSGTQRLRDIRRRFMLAYDYDPLPYDLETKTYRAANVFVLDWLRDRYCK